jgi:hypothetical protein
MAGHHPHFDDQQTVPWHASLQEGLAAAQKEGKRLFLHVGLRTCGGSRALVEKTIPKEEIAEFLRAHYVCLAQGADALEPEVAQLLLGLPRREPTPVCVYLDASGRVLHSTVGGRPPAVFLRDMTEALAKRMAETPKAPAM